MNHEDLKKDLKLLGRSLKPSATSAVLCVLVSVVIGTIVIFLTRYKDSFIRHDYQAYQANHSLSLGVLNKSLFSTGILGNALIFAFWIIVGILISFMAVDIVKGLKSAAATKQELNYVNLNKKALIRYTLIRLALRIVFLIILIIYILVLIHKILPLSIYLSIAASGGGSAFSIAKYIIGSILLTSAALHVAVILIRLTLLRPRVFTTQI